MIVKKIKREQSDKPKVWQIGDLVDYISNPRDTNAHEKIAHAGGRNFLSGTHSGQKGEMIVLAQESVRSKNPVSHWVFSFQIYIMALFYLYMSIYRLITGHSCFFAVQLHPRKSLDIPHQ